MESDGLLVFFERNLLVREVAEDETEYLPFWLKSTSVL